MASCWIKKAQPTNLPRRKASTPSCPNSKTARPERPCGWQQKLECLTGLELRVTILGYVQRGGTPSAMDRLIATQLGAATTDLIASGEAGVMVAIKNEKTVPVPLNEVVDKRRTVPLDHYWVEMARQVGTCLGD